MARASQALADDVNEPAESEPTLRETIESARDEILTREDTGAASSASAETATTADSGAAAESAGTARDQRGRFAPKDPATGGTAPPAAAGADAGQRAAPSTEPRAAAENAAPAQTQTGPADAAPQGWTPAAKAMWAQLPPLARSEINRREQDFHRQLTRHDEERNFGRSFAEVAQQFAPVITRTGLPPQAVFRDVLNIVNLLQTGEPNAKAQLLRDVGMRHGLSPQQLAGLSQQNSQPGPSGQQPSPQPMMIPPAVQTMLTEWEQQKQRQDQEQRENREREEQETLSQIMDFRSKPEARFFDAVKDHMIANLQAGVARNLEEAYEQAIWARPDIRQILQSEADAQRAAEAEKRANAQRARLRGGSVRGGTGSVANATPQDRSLREELSANFAEARSRI